MTEIRGKVSIPADFFNRAAKREYTFWGRALIREFLQNSVDAGANNVRFSFDEENLSLTVEDDGCGMTRDVILNKLLVMGGTQKPAGSVGGFGKAKEILFFAWDSYVIHTGQLLVEGGGADFVLRQVDESFSGTRCVIKFHDSFELSSVRSSSWHMLGRSEVNADLFLDGKKVPCALRRGEAVRDFTWATVYASDGKSDALSIRLRGMEMFSWWWARDLSKQFVIELKGESVDVLTANRDSLRHDYKKELNVLIESFIIDPESTGRKLDGIDELIVGCGDLLLNNKPPKSGGKAPSASFAAALDKILGHDEFPESEVSFSGFNRNFMIRRSEDAQLDRIVEFMDGTKALDLARSWSDLLADIITGTDLSADILTFRPGFLFIDGIDGGFLRKRGHPPIVFINPWSEALRDAEEMGKEFLIAFLEDVAYHELAHSKVTVHNESFMLRMRDNRLQHRKWKWCRRTRGEKDDSTSIERGGSPS